MKLQEFINHQDVDTYVEIYTDGSLMISADTNYVKNILRMGDKRGNLTVKSFHPEAYIHAGDNKITPRMVINTTSKYSK